MATDKDNTGKNYIGRKEEMFKLSFRNRKYANRTELARQTTRYAGILSLNQVPTTIFQFQTMQPLPN